jgi:hypothetical protein
MNPTEDRFASAQKSIYVAIADLAYLRKLYIQSDMEDRKARVRSLTAKIDALEAIKLDAAAYPWNEDWNYNV